jgi:4-amino-4-deoxy-L-arabinose transferase-like glycosyltransferase
MRGLSRERIVLIGFLVAAAIVYSLPLAARNLWSQDEARMALVAEDSLRHGFRLPTRLRGEPYLNKPPLFFWSVAMASIPAGRVSEGTAAIPSVASALAALGGVFALGRHLSGARTGLLALAILGTSPGFFLHSHVALPDMMLTAWITWSLYFLLRALSGPMPAARHLVGFYGCLAGALWTKGLPALMIVPAAVAAVTLSAGVRHLPRLRPGLGLAMVGLSLLPWVVPYALTPGRHRSQSLGLQSALGWYLDRQLHGSSLPLDSAFIAFLPWALWLVAALAWWRWAPDGGAYRPVWGWTLVLTVLVAASVQQRARYALPLFPPLALLVAAAATSASARMRAMARLHLVTAAALAAALLVAGAGLVVALRSRSSPTADFVRSAPWEALVVVGLAVAGTGVMLGVLWRGGAPARAMGWLAGAMGAILLIEAITYPERRAVLTPVAAFAADIGRLINPDEPLIGHPDANLAFDFYLDRRVTEERGRARITEQLQQPARGGVLVRESALSELRSSADVSWCPLARATIGARPYVLLGRCR